MTKPHLAVIILNWNGIKDTLECLDSLTQTSTQGLHFHTYVVDNASTDNSVSIITTKFPHIQLLTNSSNLGYAGGNNVGIKQALQDGASHIVLLNNDTTVAKHTFTRLYSGVTTHHFHLASPKIYFYPGREFHLKSYRKSELGHIIWYAGGHIDWNTVIPSHIGVDEFDHGQFNHFAETTFATGCCLLIRRQVFDRIGLLSTAYHAYFEDTEFCLRAHRAGFRIGFIPTSHLWHKNAGSSGGSGSTTQTKLVNPSRLRFALRYAPLRTKLAVLKNHFLKQTY